MEGKTFQQDNLTFDEVARKETAFAQQDTEQQQQSEQSGESTNVQIHPAMQSSNPKGLDGDGWMISSSSSKEGEESHLTKRGREEGEEGGEEGEPPLQKQRENEEEIDLDDLEEEEEDEGQVTVGGDDSEIFVQKSIPLSLFGSSSTST